jgi:hypothetical protein
LASRELTCVELIDAPHPFQLAIGEIVQSGEVEITGDAMDRANADLIKTTK